MTVKFEDVKIAFILILDDARREGINDKQILKKIQENLAHDASFGTNFTLMDCNCITLYPKLITKCFKSEDKIIGKLNYTTVHELIHAMINEIDQECYKYKEETEEKTHGLTMLLLPELKEFNKTKYGFEFEQKNKNQIIELEESIELEEE